MISKDNLFKSISGLEWEGNVADRFRLIYLKSTGLEKSDFNESFSPHDDKKMTAPSSSSTEYNIPETFSSEAILKQAKADLKNPDPKVRILAIKYYLEKSYPSIPMSLLQEILSDRDPDVRAQALRSLIKFRSPIVSPFLKKYLKDSNPKVRIAALRGMFQYQEKIDLNLFLQFLSDESSWVRRKVATLLGWTQMEGALPILMEMSRDQDSMVRRAALFSLVTLYPDESESRLMEAMADSDPSLRKWAKMTLEKIVARPLKRRMASLTNRG
jgi:HEAT repeat protein